VQHERLRDFLAGVDRVDALLVARRAERHHRERLRLPAREERRAVRPGQHAHLARDGADVVRSAPVRPLAALEDLPPHRLLLDRAEDLVDHRGVLRVLLDLLGQRADHVLGHARHRLIALLLVAERQRFGDTRRGERLHPLTQDGVRLGRRPRHVGNVVVGEQFLLERAQLLDRVVADLQRLEDLRLRNLERAALDHRDRFGRARDGDVHVGVLQLLERGVDQPRVLDATHTDRRDRRVERDLRHAERHGGAEQREHVRVVLLVGRQHEARDLRVVHEAVGEERPDGPVHLTGREDLLLARTSLALEEAAGDLARRVRLLAVLDRQREEREARGVVVHRDRAQHDGVAVLNQTGTVRELGHAAELQRQGSASELALQPLNHFSLLTSVVADHATDLL
jgi:hypothetical protein